MVSLVFDPHHLVTHFLGTASVSTSSYSSISGTHLMRPVYVVQADNDGGKLEAVRVRCHHHLCCCLRRGVRIGRVEQAMLLQISLFCCDFSVDLT